MIRGAPAAILRRALFRPSPASSFSSFSNFPRSFSSSPAEAPLAPLERPASVPPTAKLVYQCAPPRFLRMLGAIGIAQTFSGGLMYYFQYFSSGRHFTPAPLAERSSLLEQNPQILSTPSWDLAAITVTGIAVFAFSRFYSSRYVLGIFIHPDKENATFLCHSLAGKPWEHKIPLRMIKAVQPKGQAASEKSRGFRILQLPNLTGNFVIDDAGKILEEKSFKQIIEGEWKL